MITAYYHTEAIIWNDDDCADAIRQAQRSYEEAGFEVSGEVQSETIDGKLWSVQFFSSEIRYAAEGSPIPLITSDLSLFVTDQSRVSGSMEPVFDENDDVYG